MNWLADRIYTTLAGAAVGDALGGATEGWTPAQIRQRHGGAVTGIVPPYHENWAEARPVAPYHKGDGHITDDTLMTHALIEVYAKRRDHLDAYAVAEDLVPLLLDSPRWIPELERSAVLLHRIFLAEKWLVARLHYGHVDPREAGVGNMVNCGAAMYMAPVGIVNAGDPRGAYLEAIDVAGAHQSSFGREAAGVYAAAVAAAITPGATAGAVVEHCLALAHDGTGQAIRAVVDAVGSTSGFDPADGDAALAGTVRAAVAPYDSVGEDYRNQSMDARRPSRTKSIEELPAALGILVGTGADLRRSVLCAVNYGRDSDSIATMVGALCAAIGGPGTVPADWVQQVETASRIDLRAVAAELTAAAVDIMAKDRARATDRLSTMADLTEVVGA